MLIIKVISIALDIQNCINLYTDPDNIRQILINKYEGRCIAGCYVKEIGRILKTGDCIINQDGQPTYGTIPVIFEVTAIVYAAGEVINGCVVKNRNRLTGVLVCNADVASVMVAAHPALESVTQGQIISVRVAAVKYTISANKVSVSAVPYLFINAPVLYKMGPVTSPMIKIATDVLERIKYEEEQAAELKGSKLKEWTFFDQMLYAYKERQPAPTGAKIVDIRSILETGAAMYIARDISLNLSEGVVYMYGADSKLPADYNVRDDLKTENVIIIMLEDYCAHLKTIREMIKIYSTSDLLLSHRNLWQIFKKAKLA